MSQIDLDLTKLEACYGWQGPCSGARIVELLFCFDGQDRDPRDHVGEIEVVGITVRL